MSSDNWYEDENLWKEIHPLIFPKERYESAPEEVEKLIQLTDIQKGNVLDLCCGPGRHSIELAKRGFSVTGVDRTQIYLDEAKTSAEKSEVKIEFVKQDMGDFCRPDTYHLALSMFTSFGFFETEEENLSVLQNVHQSLKNDGIFLIDIIGKEVLASRFQKYGGDEFEGNSAFRKTEVYDDWTRGRTKWTIIKDNKVKTTFKWSHFIYSGKELKDLLFLAGFKSVCVFGDLDGTPYDANAKRLITVAKK